MYASVGVMMRQVKPVPGPLVTVATMFAANRRSVALWVVMGPVALRVLVPIVAEVTSTGFVESIPLYSSIRMSGNAAAWLKVTVTVFAFAAAAAMFLA